MKLTSCFSSSAIKIKDAGRFTECSSSYICASLSEYFFFVSQSIESFFLFFFFVCHNSLSFFKIPQKFHSPFVQSFSSLPEQIHFSFLYLQPAKMFLLLFNLGLGFQRKTSFLWKEEIAVCFLFKKQGKIFLY